MRPSSPISSKTSHRSIASGDPLRIILDTGVFYRRDALDALATSQDDIIVPVVALAERLRQIRRDGGDPAAFRRALVRAQFDVEALDEPAATRYSLELEVDAEWRKLSHDAFIAGHVREGDMLWTTNPNDFEALGVPTAQIVRVE